MRGIPNEIRHLIKSNQAPRTYSSAWLATGKNKELADQLWKAIEKRIKREKLPVPTLREQLREQVRHKLARKASEACPWTSSVIVRWARETTVYVNRGQTILDLRPGDRFHREGNEFVTETKKGKLTWKKQRNVVTCSIVNDPDN